MNGVKRSPPEHLAVDESTQRSRANSLSLEPVEDSFRDFEPSPQIAKAAQPQAPHKSLEITATPKARPITLKDGVPRMDPEMKTAIPALILLNDMVYAMGQSDGKKLDKYMRYFKDAGWQIKMLPGLTGAGVQMSADVPALLAYNRQQDKMYVAFRGSQKLPDEAIHNAKDWQANFDAFASSNTDLSKKLPDGMKVARGFANRTASVMPTLEHYIRTFWEQNIEEGHPEKNANLKVILSGHSQGAALASLAIMDLATNLGKELYGKDFNNTESNTFSAYVFSAPRSVAGDEKTRAWFDQNVGTHNVIRQNVEGDMVPSLPLQAGAKSLALASGIDKMSGRDFLSSNLAWLDLGYLALDKSRDAGQRRPRFARENLNDRKMKKPAPGYVESIADWLAPRHYGSKEHYIPKHNQDFGFDPVIADTTGILARQIPDILGEKTDSKIRRALFSEVNAEHLRDPDELLAYGHKK